ncbi:SpoIIE family protein phosphatase [Microbispora hainanensis]|uniref:SpoIIE family protein phosphatase n=1 Tax=Microbispora hainanensis TaxID=568844 RepID=A0ABZ1SVC6_9ACTN|nr:MULTISPECIES: GAF domain-containing SpoIIE family protein phosphatase [Microbispora]NJP27312.1 serine/threonine-protein phosphatase [Microbispora sp. CL1-1]TQS11361.1 serine/threonine-protein phosphatase [Microbispora sp. SCL1-1]
MNGCPDTGRIWGGLVRDHHLTPLEDLASFVIEHVRPLGFSEVMIYVASLRALYLVPLPGQSDAYGEPLNRLAIDTTLAGRAFRDLEIVQARPAVDPYAAETAEPLGSEAPRRLWVPMLNGTERVGVLGVTVPVVDAATERILTELGGLVALLVVSKRAYSDAFARLVRTEEMHLSAEMLWTLLPVKSFATETMTVSAALEPAYRVGGDAFDYALDGTTLHLGIFDAMGHDTSAGLTAAIALSAYRNNRRRRRAGLLDVSDAIDEAIAGEFGASRFATAVLADLDLRTGWLTWVNRGHPPPLVLRRGRLACVLDTPPDTPMGLRLGPASVLARRQLEPGDRLLFYTDGIIEAQTPDGERFGLERFADFVIRREFDGVAAPESLRRLIHSILVYQRGRLQDDATVLLAEWRTGRERRHTM